MLAPYKEVDKDFISSLQDIEVGKAVRPQLAHRVSDATTAWKKVFIDGDCLSSLGLSTLNYGYLENLVK